MPATASKPDPFEQSWRALADPTRRDLFERLRSGPSSVGDLAARVPVSQPAVSQHLAVLVEAGLVDVRPEGRRRVYRAVPSGLKPLRSWIERMWDDALDGFVSAAEDVAASKPRSRPRKRSKQS